MSVRTPRLLIPDNTPLTLLSMIGSEALDWLFAPGAEVWVTDMVRQEALRDPEPGDDWRAGQRALLQGWFGDNAHRLRVQPTAEGLDYEREMRNWVRGGKVPADRPSRRNRGERSMQDLLPIVGQMVTAGEALILLVDDRPARALLLQEARTGGVETDIMATETFLVLLEQDYGVTNARDAWVAIQHTAGGKQPGAAIEGPD